MNGLEKITDKIISEAEKYAAAVVAEAEKKARATDAEYERLAASIADAAKQKAQTESERAKQRAESSGRMLRAEAELAARAEMLDECFSAASERIANSDGESYSALFGKQLESAVLSAIASERTAAERGDDEGDVTVDEYQVILNARDKARAAEIIKYAESAAASGGKRIFVAEDCTDIAGGFILRCGDIEINCSLETLMKQTRARLEAQVSRCLFE